MALVVAAAQDGADPGEQFGVAEGFADDVVGAVFEVADAGEFVAAGGEHDQRRVGVDVGGEPVG